MYGALTLAVAFCISAPALKDPAKQSPIVGTWEVTEMWMDGFAITLPIEWQNRIYQFNSDNTYMTKSNQFGPSKSTYKVDPKKTPHELNLLSADSTTKESMLAIFKVEGDRLTISIAVVGHPRPTEFISKPTGACDAKHLLYYLQRCKEK